ncbi:hypothetical protein V5P93_000411 [Actinokineospora auranticolor]|uniref:Uncharacterized protein n=1 Tax=Actinokineospora auranticolor TaxID=155976 RepID=A0A2S6GE72_9PSEU|nr:hypothetical protein [Actinokineospora auranticolor]PPK63534.1 hypothetical protein CLV40_12761 [Actinokineospora auranticolor]
MTQPRTERPRPLRTAARIVGGITALIAGLANSGVITPTQGNAIQGVITAVLILLGSLGIVVLAEPKVTPLSDPRDDQGRPLTPSE